MKIEEIKRTVITASEGMILTDGKSYGRVIGLATDRNPNEFYEIPEAEYQRILEAEREKEEEK